MDTAIKDAKLAKKIYNSQFDKYMVDQAKYKVNQDTKKKSYQYILNLKHKKIFFAGSGDGLECNHAIKKQATVTGIDISERGVELARKNCPKGKFLVGDIEKTPFKSNSFDIIISFNVLQYKKNLKKTLLEFRRILKKSGRILIVVPHPIRKMLKYNNNDYFIKGRKWEMWQNIKRFNYYRTTEDYINSIIQAGFQICEMHEPKPVKQAKNTPDSEVSHPHQLIIIFKK